MAEDHLTSENEEIDLLEIFKILISNRKRIFLGGIIGVALGVLVALISQSVYRAEVVFVPQYSSGSNAGGQLSGLASLVGIDVGSGGSTSEMSPTLYPKLINSTTFMEKILSMTISHPDNNGNKISFEEYYSNVYKPSILSLIKKYTIGLPRQIKRLFSNKSEELESPNRSGDQFKKYTTSQIENFNRIKSQLNFNFNDKDGFMSISFEMPNALMSAEMTNQVAKLLEQEVIDYRINKAKEQLEYTQERLLEKKAEFDIARQKLAQFEDQNKSIISGQLSEKRKELEANYSLAFEVYTELAKQLESVKLQVARDTPAFLIIDPVTVPAERAAPKRIMIVVLFTALGFLVTIVILFASNFYSKLKKEFI